MPSSHDILDGLTRIAQEWTLAAVLWHIVLAALLVALVKDIWRPSALTAALVATAPVASAAAFAWVGGNFFNGALLSAGTLALATLALRFDRRPLQWGSASTRWVGAGMLLFGWIYPHFLGAQSLWLYFVASPVGLVPCPSLSIAIGLALFCEAFGSRAWGLTVSVLGLFYGIVGVARLGVTLDLPLVVGAALLFVRSAHPVTVAKTVAEETQHGTHS